MSKYRYEIRTVERFLQREFAALTDEAIKIVGNAWRTLLGLDQAAMREDTIASRLAIADLKAFGEIYKLYEDPER